MFGIKMGGGIHALRPGVPGLGGNRFMHGRLQVAYRSATIMARDSSLDEVHGLFAELKQLQMTLPRKCKAAIDGITTADGANAILVPSTGAAHPCLASSVRQRGKRSSAAYRVGQTRQDMSVS